MHEFGLDVEKQLPITWHQPHFIQAASIDIMLPIVVVVVAVVADVVVEVFLLLLIGIS